MIRRPWLLAIAIALGATGCQIGWTLVSADEPFVVNDGYSVEPQIEWSRMKLKYVDELTIHGGGLESLRLTRGLKDGEPMVKPPTRKDEMPLFNTKMSASEIAEFTEDTIARTGGIEVKSSGLAPYPFAGLDGFRFDFTFAAESGLRFSGLAAGATFKKRLYLVIFTAPELHYFGTYRDTVEKLIESATITPDDD